MYVCGWLEAACQLGQAVPSQDKATGTYPLCPSSSLAYYSRPADSRRLAAIADLVVYEVSIQVIEKVGKAGFFADSLATVPHRIGQGRVPRCVRDLAGAEWLPFSWGGEIFGCRKAPGSACALDLPEQGDGTVKAARLEVRGYGDVPACGGGGADEPRDGDARGTAAADHAGRYALGGRRNESADAFYHPDGPVRWWRGDEGGLATGDDPQGEQGRLVSLALDALIPARGPSD